MLIAAKADLNIQDINGNSLAMLAVASKDVDIVKLLFINRVNFNIPNNDGITPIAKIISEENIQLIEFFILNKPVNTPDSILINCYKIIKNFEEKMLEEKVIEFLSLSKAYNNINYPKDLNTNNHPNHKYEDIDGGYSSDLDVGLMANSSFDLTSESE